MTTAWCEGPLQGACPNRTPSIGTGRANADFTMVSRTKIELWTTRNGRCPLRAGCVLIALVALTASCRPKAQPLPTAADLAARDERGFDRAEVPEPPGIDDAPGAVFVLAPGDVLHVRALLGEGLGADRLVVDAAGAVTLPFVGSVVVGGLPLDAATDRVHAALRTYERFATVHLEVLDPAGHKATVLGTVTTPGRHALGPETRLADLIAMSGGPLAQTSEGESISLADLDAATLVREGRALPLSVRRAIAGDPRHNVRVQAGDLLYVPSLSGQRVTILGEVRAPKTVPYRAGMTLTDAVAIAGGPTADADEGDLRVIRGPLSAPRIYRASLPDIIYGRALNAPLAPGDIVYVTEHWSASATQVLNRLTPLMAIAALTVGIAR
jgi:polysaccharide export outer membrane protein